MKHTTLLIVAMVALVGCQPAALPDIDPEVAVIRMADGGEITIKFYTSKAPGHVDNFKSLARTGYYDGTTFHRVIPGFMIQGGDHQSKDDNPRNDGRGNPGYYIDAEFNDMLHRRGIVAMARSEHPNSAGSQFYIMVSNDAQWGKILDGKYTVFGSVIDGMDVVDRIVATPRDKRDRPLENQVMQSVRIEPAAEE
jgi:peptidyl-prolyl cis-trans isomerase B (cyclophilin B)